MALLAKNTTKKMDPVAAGIHKAICTSVVDLGTTYNEIFKKSSRKILLSWLLPDSTIEIKGEDLPRMISKQCTLSLHPKAKLRNLLESWMGRGFDREEEIRGVDLKQLLCMNCNLQIIHKKNGTGETFATVANVFPLDRKEWREPETETVYFSFDDSTEVPKNIPEWVQGLIEKAEEYDIFLTSNQADDGDDINF